MPISARTGVLFNIAALLAATAAVGAVVRSWVYTPAVAPCEERYRNVLHFKLDRDGQPISPVDLQARSAGRESGVLENLTIARVTGAPKPIVMRIALDAAGSRAAAPSNPAGASFPWQPDSLRGHTAACLAYSVLLTAQTEKQSGILPGLAGATETDELPFEVHPAWLHNGQLGLAHRAEIKPQPPLAASRDGDAAVRPRLRIESSDHSFAKGRWVRVNQEVVLNAPQKADGVARLWIDGKLVAERVDLRLRADAAVSITGVAASAQLVSGAAPHSTGASTASLTPFELFW